MISEVWYFTVLHMICSYSNMYVSVQSFEATFYVHTEML